jgi:hypothetical protein
LSESCFEHEDIVARIEQLGYQAVESLYIIGTNDNHPAIFKKKWGTVLRFFRELRRLIVTEEDELLANPKLGGYLYLRRSFLMEIMHRNERESDGAIFRHFEGKSLKKWVEEHCDIAEAAICLASAPHPRILDEMSEVCMTASISATEYRDEMSLLLEIVG